MMRRPPRLLALDLSARGFGFAVVDERLGLIDFGCSSFVASDDARFCQRVAVLLARHGPTALVLESYSPRRTKTTAMRRSMLAFLFVESRQIGMVHVSRNVVRRVLGVATKAAAAEELARRFPELQRLLPRRRAPWQAEHKRMSIFDALAFAVAVLATFEHADGRRDTARVS